jgi:hypothetical protein
MNSLIGLYSPCPQCGKTTLAGLLDGFRLYSFADPLRAMIASLLRFLGYDDMRIWQCFNGDLKEVPIPEFGGRTPRYLLQTIGTEWGRELITPEIWTNIMDARLRDRKGPVVIDDMRFPNEYDMLKAQGALLVRIDRPGYVKTGNHASDGALDGHGFDLYITNDGEPEWMLQQLKGWRG